MKTQTTQPDKWGFMRHRANAEECGSVKCVSCNDLRELLAERDALLSALQSLTERAAKDAESYAQEGNEPIWAHLADAQEAIALATSSTK